jgi:hypothetical protein
VVNPTLKGRLRDQFPRGAVASEVWHNPATAFGAERRRLKDVLNTDEEILGSDPIHAIKELPELSEPLVLVVTNRAPERKFDN